MVTLVHIAPQNKIKPICRNGIAPTKLRYGSANFPGYDRLVWAFPVLSNYTLTHSWARELKRTGATTLCAIYFRVPDEEPVFANHYSSAPLPMSAAKAVETILAVSDPRGYQIMIPRRLEPREIIRTKILSQTFGWRYWPEAKGKPIRLCDCPFCLPRGEVKANHYRQRVFARIKAADLERNR